MSRSKHGRQPALQRGFTIIELLVVAPIVILVIGAFITVIVSLTGNVLASRASSNLLFNVQDGLNRMEQDIKLSSGFLAVNSITPQTGQGFDDGTAGFQNVSTTNGTMLILNTIATTANPLQASSYVYAIDPLNACNSPQVIQNTPESMNIIYFVKNGTLWRRTLMQSNYTNTTTAWCNLAWQLPSCTPGYTASFCKTQDIQIVSGLGTTGFNVTYYTGAGNTLANSAASDPGQSDSSRAAALASATTASVSLTANLTAAGRTISQSSTLRATRLDINASSIYVPPTTTIPSAPSGLTASLTTPGQVLVSWNPNATTYNLQYDTTNAFSSPTTISSISGSSQTVTGLNGSPIYYFRVQATNSAGTGAWSSSVGANSTITNGLVGWWNLNGNANKTAGTTINGTVTGATLVAGQNGTANGAYSFNGTNQYISLASTFGLGITNLTTSLWAYNPTATNSGSFIKVGNVNGAGNGQGYGIGIGGAQFDNSTPGTKLVALFESVRWIATTKDVGTGWHYIVMTIDGSGIPSIYEDGALVGTYSGTVANAPTGSLTVIGANQNTSTRFFNGRIDDVRLYNRALSASEILSLYNAGAE